MVRIRSAYTDGEMMGLTTSPLPVYTKRSIRVLVVAIYLTTCFTKRLKLRLNLCSWGAIFTYFGTTIKSRSRQSGNCVALGRTTPSRSFLQRKLSHNCELKHGKIYSQSQDVRNEEQSCPIWPPSISNFEWSVIHLGNDRQPSCGNESHNWVVRIVDAKPVSFQSADSTFVTEKLQKIQKLLQADFPEYIQHFGNSEYSWKRFSSKAFLSCCSNHESLWPNVSTSTQKPETNQFLWGWPCSRPM
jgi:hypothetical protein